MYNGRVVSFVGEMGSSYGLNAERRLAEIHLAASIVEVESWELVASQAAANTDRQTSEEAEFVGDGDYWTLSIDCADGADLMADRVHVHWTVQQPTIL